MSARTALSAVVALFIAACDQAPVPTALEADPGPSFSAESDRIVEEFPFVIPDWYLDCLDEEVVWSGTGLFEDHVVIKPDGSVHENGKVSLLNSTMVGASGTWIEPVVVNHFNSGDGQGNLYVNERITWTNQATGDVMDVWSRIHIVVTGAGEVMVLADTEGATCELR